MIMIIKHRGRRRATLVSFLSLNYQGARIDKRLVVASRTIIFDVGLLL
jgi:hypothetical protein